MPDQVTLTRKGGGGVRADFKMYNARTPSHGDMINVDLDGESVKARVTEIVHVLPVDHVSATEV
jgi:hypothetical protein